MCNFKINELKWQLIQECTSLSVNTGLSVNFEILFDPSNPQVLSLPKLKWFQAPPKDKAQTVKEYNLPALEELVKPSVRFLRALSTTKSIKYLTLESPTQEIIDIVADYTRLEQLTFTEAA